MKQNIFQKIAFLVYISIILLICAYFVPYQNNDNYTFYSSIMTDGYGTISYFRFIIYLIVPTLSFYFVCKYLEAMNSLEFSVYKKKAKRELYVFFVFIGLVIGSILFLYGKNEYCEIRKERLKSQISEINFSFDKLRNELSKRPPLDLSAAQDILNENVDEYGIKIKKPTEKLNLDLGRNYHETYEKNVHEVLKKTSNVVLSVIKRKQLEMNIKELIDNGSSFNDLNKMIVDYVEMFSKNGIKKTKLEFELKEIVVYSEEEIKKKIIFTFLASFMLFYIIRPLFSMFKGMFKEVN
jgi:hypothetical protein